MSLDKKVFLVSKKTWFSLFLTALLFGTIALTQFATLQTRDSRSKAACTTSGSFNFDNPTSIDPSWSGWDGHYYIYVYKFGQSINEAVWTLHYSSISGSRTFITTAAVLEGGAGYQATIYLHNTSSFVVWRTVGFNSNPCPPPPTSTTITANGVSGTYNAAYNQSVAIRWVGTNASSCSVSPTGWSGVNATATINVTTPTTYTASCTGAGSPSSAQVRVNVAAAPPPPPPVAVDPPPPPPVAVDPPPPVVVNPPPAPKPPPPAPVNPPPPPGGGCILVFCAPPPPPPPPPLVKKPVQPAGPKVTPPGVTPTQIAGVDDITLNFAPNSYLQGGMEVIVLVDNTAISQKVVVEKAGGTFILKTSELSKNSIYKMRISSKNSLINLVTFTYVNSTLVMIPVFITGDFNADNSINETDLTKLVPDGMKSQDSLYDINYDGVVNSVDYAILLANLGKNG